MHYVKPGITSCLLAILFMMTGCQEITDDLIPSSDDKRPVVQTGSIGSQPGQLAPDFTAIDSKNSSHTLADELALSNGVVLYFTMWCPICDSHMDHIRTHLIQDFPNIRFLVVDYVTGSISASRASQLANGYAGFTVLTDSDQALFNAFKGSMGTTVIINSSGIIRLNEDYKDGRQVRTVLTALGLSE